MPGIIGNTGWDRSRACTWDFSSTHNTTVRSGGSRYRPTTSRTFSMNSGSLLSLNVSARCGLRRNAFQIRPTVDFDSPDRFAIDARDQWVASFGACSKVATTTSSTLSSLIFRGAPGRSSSTRPSSRRTTNRDRHLPTVGRDTPSRPATSALDSPSAHASTIRHRNANACALLRRWDQRTNVSRSTSDSASSAFGRPRPAIRQSLHQQSHHRDTTLPQLEALLLLPWVYLTDRFC